MKQEERDLTSPGQEPLIQPPRQGWSVKFMPKVIGSSQLELPTNREETPNAGRS